MKLNTRIGQLAIIGCLLPLGLYGCATNTLLKKDAGHYYTQTKRIDLVNDQVVAFGQPATAVNGIPPGSVVIAGQKNSYILTKGGTRFAELITRFDARNFQVNEKIDFYSEKNDGRFTGTLPLSYVQLKDKITTNDMELFIQAGARECSSSSDERMLAQRFCFNIPMEGVIFPAAANLSSLKPLTKAYSVSIYTQQQSQEFRSGRNPLNTLMLLPFAVAIDVVTLPFQAAEKIFD